MGYAVPREEGAHIQILTAFLADGGLISGFDYEITKGARIELRPVVLGTRRGGGLVAGWGTASETRSCSSRHAVKGIASTLPCYRIKRRGSSLLRHAPSITLTPASTNNLGFTPSFNYINTTDLGPDATTTSPDHRIPFGL
ncbi:hypothetical protein V502_07241 [Pseudogymnoascus sp. VKM F-4520 (FW-2644)]|nr:hypothetical protein V502_07241 [Pseudogymnoascus sp. VKM F-4520 (FW-2644)]